MYDILNNLVEYVQTGAEGILDEIEAAKCDIYEEQKLVCTALDTVSAVMHHDIDKFLEEQLAKAQRTSEKRRKEGKTAKNSKKQQKITQNSAKQVDLVPIIGTADNTH